MANKNPVVVCVDDDEAMLSTVVRCLKREPFEIRSTLSATEALSWVASDDIAVLVSDYDMPEMTGAQLAGYVKRIRPETVRVLLTGRRTLDTAIDGINQGEIFRFIGKPFEDKQLRQAVLDAAHRHEELAALSGDRRRRERREALRRDLEAEYPGISSVVRRDDKYVASADPWADAQELAIFELVAELETT